MKVFEIPSKVEHEGYPGNLIKVEMPDHCYCGGVRAVRVWRGLSYDGSRRLSVDCWENSCGHVDKYYKIIADIEAGINSIVSYDTPTELEKKETVAN